MKLGSLFDGSGGFPLAGAMCGIEPVWASEIEPFPIKVTTARFPGMKHLGNVKGIKGGEIEPVDILTFGSPCQDVSLAGRRNGLNVGKRSSLFFEAIRIVEEMRNATTNNYPRFIVFENVPGLFTSNNGDDFRTVLQSLCDLCREGNTIPKPSTGEGWQPVGSVLGTGYSIAWRVYDAERFGMPVRRKRIYLIADFRSERAAQTLFGESFLQWDSDKGGKTWQNASKFVAGCFERELLTNPDYIKNNEVIVFKERAGKGGGGKGILFDNKTAFTLATIVEQAICYESTSGEKVVRRFTKTELARLQGFPDWWTDGVDGNYLDHNRLWGNGISLPCAVDVLGRLAKEGGKA